MLDWGDLRFFLEVARTGTLAAAGRALGVESTTVGRRLAALERDLGARLFSRTPDGLVVTSAGEAIRAAGEEMESAVLRGEQRAQNADRKLAGVVRVTTTEMLAELVVLPALEALRARQPQIRLHLSTGTGRLDLARREADVALRYVRPEGGDLVVRKAASIAFAGYASRKYLAERGHPKGRGGFAGHDLLAFETGVRHWRLGLLDGEPFREGRVVLKSNSVLALLAAARMGLGIGPLPCVLAAADERLERVPAMSEVELDDLWLVVHADVHRTSRVRAVIDALEERLEAIGPQLSGAEVKGR